MARVRAFIGGEALVMVVAAGSTSRAFGVDECDGGGGDGGPAAMRWRWR